VTDWKARAEREAAAIIAEALPNTDLGNIYPMLVSVAAIAWLQGADFGSHVTLGHLEDTFDELRAAL
jgi:hypothetical protein